MTAERPLRGLPRWLRANPERKTRFHTARGELMPAAAWVELPGRMSARLRGASGTEPWIIPSAIAWLERTIEPHWSVLELGSGKSTSWLARRAGHVLSFEDDPEWHRRAVEEAAGARNLDVTLVSVDAMPDAAGRLPDGSINLVVIDCNESEATTRLDCLNAAAPKVRAGGYLLLDDSDSPAYRDADGLLPGWEARRFVGVKPFPLMAVETSVYRRPA